jgi:3',5'-cyclic-nucleotide phosphodiesterase
MQSRADQLGYDGVLILQVGSETAPLLVQIRTEIILGRSPGQDDGRTYINLEPYDAELSGVSRKHAALVRNRQAVYVVDLNSTNGTCLNGERVAPGDETRLRDGDELTLGKLKLFAYFKA